CAASPAGGTSACSGFGVSGAGAGVSAGFCVSGGLGASAGFGVSVGLSAGFEAAGFESARVASGFGRAGGAAVLSGWLGLGVSTPLSAFGAVAVGFAGSVAVGFAPSAGLLASTLGGSTGLLGVASVFEAAGGWSSATRTSIALSSCG